MKKREDKRVKARFLQDKKALELEMLGWILLGLSVLILVIVGMIILTGKGSNAIDFIKNLFRGR